MCLCASDYLSLVLLSYCRAFCSHTAHTQFTVETVTDLHQIPHHLLKNYLTKVNKNKQGQILSAQNTTELKLKLSWSKMSQTVCFTFPR